MEEVKVINRGGEGCRWGSQRLRGEDEGKDYNLRR